MRVYEKRKLIKKKNWCSEDIIQVKSTVVNQKSIMLMYFHNSDEAFAYINFFSFHMAL